VATTKNLPGAGDVLGESTARPTRFLERDAVSHPQWRAVTGRTPAAVVGRFRARPACSCSEEDAVLLPQWRAVRLPVAPLRLAASGSYGRGVRVGDAASAV
jgi:hypothetical protein